ncbi:MAG: Do family serine endopeptidase, partial [Pseudomonadota bacterium]
MKFLTKFVCLFAFAAFPVMAAEPPASFADLVEKLTPTVVNISTTQKIKGGIQGQQMFELPQGGEMPEEFRDFFEQFAKPNGKQAEREVFSLGSGFVIDENGYIATNNHVIADADEITVIFSDDSKLKAKIVGRDVKTDLALLKVEAGKKLPAAVLGDSDNARVGDWVIAIGNPFGLGGTVTAGIVSARARNINSGPFDDFIQTDAAINRGNSVGPLFNSKGEVVGINTAIFSPTGGSIGIGFAVPMALAKPVFSQLKSSGKIERGWLGVKIQQVTEEIADSVGLKKNAGALVVSVAKGSPAEIAGILPQDIIILFDGKEIKEMRSLTRIVAETKNGKATSVEVWRKGVAKTLTIKVGELRDNEHAENEELGNEKPKSDLGKGKELLGLLLGNLIVEEREKYNLPPDAKG